MAFIGQGADISLFPGLERLCSLVRNVLRQKLNFGSVNVIAAMLPLVRIEHDPFKSILPPPTVTSCESLLSLGPHPYQTFGSPTPGTLCFLSLFVCSDLLNSITGNRAPGLGALAYMSSHMLMNCCQGC